MSRNQTARKMLVQYDSNNIRVTNSESRVLSGHPSGHSPG